MVVNLATGVRVVWANSPGFKDEMGRFAARAQQDRRVDDSVFAIGPPAIRVVDASQREQRS